MTYHDLQHDIAERVRPPGFEEVLVRASAARRRRRTTVGAGLAASLVVGGLAFAVADPGRSDGRSGEPVAPSPTRSWDETSEAHPDLPAEVRELLGSDFLDARSTSGSGTGIATIWHACPDGENCRTVLTTRVGNVTEGRVLRDGAVSELAPVPDGWLLEDADGLSRLTLAGELERVTEAAGFPVPSVEPGDTAVWSPVSGWRLLRGAELRPLPAPTGAEVESAYVTPSGRLVVATSDGSRVDVSVSDDGGTWQTARADSAQEPAAGAYVAGNGDTVAVALLGAAPDGSIPLLGVHASHDAGASWLAVRSPRGVAADQLRDLSAMTVSPSGAVLLTTGSHGLLRVVEPDGAMVESRLSSDDHGVFAVEDGACVVVEADWRDHLQCTSDDGWTWQAQPLPGFR